LTEVVYIQYELKMQTQSVRQKSPGCVASALLLVALSTGCDKSKESEEAGGGASEDEPAEPAEVKGLHASSSDPAVVALVEEVLTCEWSDDWGPASSCEAYRAWQRSDELKAADATLVNMLEDPDDKLRYLASEAIGPKSWATAFRDDAALVGRILAAAKVETHERVASWLGDALAEVSYADIGDAELTDAAMGLLKTHDISQLRASLASGLLEKAPAHPGLYELYVGLARNVEEADVRFSTHLGLRGAMTLDDDKKTAVCEVWTEGIGSTDENVASLAGELMARFEACSEKWDALLEGIAERAEQGRLAKSANSWRDAKALKDLHAQDQATDDQKKRAVAVAKTLVENTQINVRARTDALRFVGDADPNGARFAARFLEDENSTIRRWAQELQ
jgi:hypothetical protein